MKEVSGLVKQTKQQKLDRIAELEIDAILHKLENPETLTASELAVVRKFMKDNYLIIDHSTKGMSELKERFEEIPEFDDLVQ